MTHPYDADVLIIGGGLNGGALALALASGGLSSIVCDAAPAGILEAPEFDGRASAIAAGSRNMLTALGVWPDLASNSQPMTDILVSDGRVGDGASPFFLHFDHQDIGSGPFGHMVENRHMRHALMTASQRNPLIDMRFDCPATNLTADGGGAIAQTPQGPVRARLAVACDGRKSATARAAGIAYRGWDYNQHGLVATVTHAQPHQGVAHEYFLPSGPFAILPLTGHRSSLVWTERPAIADAAMRLDDVGFEGEIHRRFGDFLGEIRLTGPRWRYPLSMQLAERYTASRLALVGDAAHGVHPIAGQGFNLGLLDSAALAEILTEAARRGEDIGAPDVLDRYDQARRLHNTAMALGMDAINRLFSNDLPPVQLARRLGLTAVNKTAPLRRYFMRQAAGLSGSRPRLFRGEIL